MAKIGTWSTTPASNNQSPPDGWPEGQIPSTTNDCRRQDKADIRTFVNTSEWFDWGDTPSRASSTTFKISTNVTDEYTVNRRIKCFDATTLHATIISSSYSAPDTTIGLALDSGSLTTSLSSVALATLRPTNISVPSTIGRKGTTIASAGTTDIGAADADFIDISGTTTITGLGTIDAGVERTVRFTGALTLTHNATSLILPSAANITTAANDTAIFRSLGSGNWLCSNYTKANGTALVFSSGIILQMVTANVTSASSLALTAGTFTDVTGVTLSIKPASVASRIFINCTACYGSSGGANALFTRIMRDSTPINIGDAAGSRMQCTSGYFLHTIIGAAKKSTCMAVDSPSTSATIVYKIQVAPILSGTVYINRSTEDLDNTAYVRVTSSITAMEISS